MAYCDFCGRKVALPYTCRYCGGIFCSKHRLPESHSCEGLEEVSRRSREKRRIYKNASDELRWRGLRRRTLERPSRDAGFSRKERREKFNILFKSLFKGTLDLVKMFLLRNATILLLLLMVLVFLGQLVVMGLFGSAYYIPGEYGTFLYYLAPSQATVLSRPWTLTTCLFTHGGFLHLMINGIVMFFMGLALERRIGRNRLMCLFLGSGAIAALAQILLIPPNIVVLGASGAILGVVGTLTVLAPRMPVLLFFFLPLPLWIVALGYGTISAVFALSGAGGSIGHMAHFTGLMVGLAYGYKLRGERRHIRRAPFYLSMKR